MTADVFYEECIIQQNGGSYRCKHKQRFLLLFHLISRDRNNIEVTLICLVFLHYDIIACRVASVGEEFR